MEPKPDGTICVGIDVRQLKAVSSFLAYPMPCIEDLLHRVGEATYLSTLDLAKGYWQIPFQGENKEKKQPSLAPKGCTSLQRYHSAYMGHQSCFRG